MICQSCNQNVATVHLTEIMNKEKKEVHLCEECAKDKGISYKANFSVQELISHLSTSQAATAGAAKASAGGDTEGEESGASGSSQTVGAQTACPSCGLTFGEFRSTGRLGCPEDYVHFKRGLVPLLEKIHGATHHIGKVPSSTATSSVSVAERQRELTKIRQELNVAIEKEEYERAAELRDQIRRLEENEGAPSAVDGAGHEGGDAV